MVVDDLVLRVDCLFVVSLAVTEVDLVGLDPSVEVRNEVSDMAIVAFACRLDLKLILVGYNNSVLDLLSIRSVDNLLSLD